MVERENPERPLRRLPRRVLVNLLEERDVLPRRLPRRDLRNLQRDIKLSVLNKIV
jgi:hypothetical protein